MKALVRSLLFVSALSSAACNVTPEEAAAMEAEALATQEQAATTNIYNYCPNTIPGPPALPTTAPVPLSSLPTTRPLYPPNAGLMSAYTVIVADPSDTNRFIAFGFDVVGHRTQFYVSGDLRTGELRRLNVQIANDIEVIEQTSGYDPGFSWGSSSQVGGPIIPRPTVHEGAWKTAFNNRYQLNEIMMRPTTPVP
ncbi:hypothetical protein HPC49_04070 [Pyxidicoccus fallax]|uniref:Lipoprotein n=1 Tax=Pyxidicoccus fallax TaxID=394095 RepID=A0A848LHD8_9BACT|nr:hypothetical protein [Pyxidicoccus fallax]NMO16511.1 hypothetical protein [Pyxidicoccus fallax]NPC77427.1 hypothetical protein [Pyxidicoccus fallax]